MRAPDFMTAAKVFVLAAAMMLGGCCQLAKQDLESHRPDARTEALLMELRASLQAAMIQGDRAVLERLLDESFVFVHSTGRLEPRPAFIDRMVQAGASHRVSEIDFSDNDIRVYGHTAVWVTRSSRRGTSMAFVGTDVLVEAAGGWKWVSVQSTRIEP